jgi:hypothetical protein
MKRAVAAASNGAAMWVRCMDASRWYFSSREPRLAGRAPDHIDQPWRGGSSGCPPFQASCRAVQRSGYRALWIQIMKLQRQHVNATSRDVMLQAVIEATAGRRT